MSADDERLVLAATGGDAGALEELLRRHEAQIYRFGQKLCRDPEDAKDVLQDTLLAAARSIRSFRGASSFSTWLYAIAHSACIKRRRPGGDAARRPGSIDVDSGVARAIADSSGGPEDIAARRQLARALDRAIAALDPAGREVLVLRDAEGLKAAEVAEVLGISVDAVKSRLHRARVAVRRTMAPLLEPSGAPAPSAECPEIVELFSRHLEGEIDAETCARMERHVDRCPHCRTACEALKETLVLCRDHARGEVPPAIQATVRKALRSVIQLAPP